jgi:Cysteine-rich secretory protein family
MLKRALLSVAVTGFVFSLALAATVEEKHPNGKLKAVYVTDKAGRKDGFYVEYHENGKAKVKATYRAGELEGSYTAFHPNGATHINATYKQGKRTGTYSERDDHGRLVLKAGYRDGTVQGSVKIYDKGTEVFSQPFHNGAPVWPRSLEKIRAALGAISTSPAAPRGNDPAAAERLAALQRLKAYRYLVGVPYENLELDAEMNRCSEAGARLCAAIGRLDHTPANPGWKQADYQLAYKGTSHGNLAQGPKTLSACVDGWMDDSDARNIVHVGHRRWCINPAMQKTGFGRSGVFGVMYAHDNSQPKVPEYEYLCYPPAGFMPIDYFRPHHAWSVSLNPKKYRAPDTALKVRVYEVDEVLSRKGDLLPLNQQQVSIDGPVGPCVIFRPEKITVADGQRYLVEIDGIQSTSGQAVPVRYLVVFVDLNAKS